MNLIARRLAAALVAGALSLSLAGAAFAQKGERRGTPNLSPAMLQRLNLSLDQQTKIKTATDVLHTDLQKARDITAPKEKRAAIRTARSKYDASVKATLSAQQQQQLAAVVTAVRDYRGLGPMGTRLAALNLTADQKTRVKGIVTKYQPELEQARAAAKGAADKTAARGQRRSIQRKMSTEIRAVLTPEQQKQLGERRRGKKANKPAA